MKTPSINIRSRTRVLQWAATISLVAMAITAKAQITYSEDFESGTNSFVPLPGGTPPSTGLVLDSTKNKIPASGGSYSLHATDSGNSTGLSLPTAIGATKSCKLTCYMYDSTLTRFFTAFRNYTDGTINGGLNQVIAIGKYNSVSGIGGEVYDSTKYQGRILNPTGFGFFNLNGPGAPARATGWHKFDIERGVNSNSTVTYNFFVDNVMCRSFTITRTQATDAPNVITVGSAGSPATGAGDTWFDGYSLLIGQPYISAQPQAQTVTQGQALTVTAQVVGANVATNVLTYQWRKNGVNIPGATGTSISFPTSDPTNSGGYAIVASNLFGIAISTNATITVNPLIFISGQPQGMRVNLGETANFSATVTGNGNLFYQWKKNGSNIGGQTTSALSIANAQVSDRGSYTVVVTNDVNDPAVTSTAAVLQVNTAPQIFSGNLTLPPSAKTLEISVPFTEDYSTNGVPFQDFESFSNGDIRMFDHPAFSGTTTNFLDLTQPEYAKVTNSFPGGHGGKNVLKASWWWSQTASGDWLRFTTAGSGATFSPIIPTNYVMHFDMYSEKDVMMAYMVRENSPTGNIGDNGGGTGGLELVGISAVSPPTVAGANIVYANTWTRMTLDIPTATAAYQVGSYSQGSTGNNNVDSTTGKCTLESLVFNPIDITTPEVIYLDNFTISPADPLVFNLDAGPDGATIDPVTGKITWLPPGNGVYNFTVSAKDTVVSLLLIVA